MSEAQERKRNQDVAEALGIRSGRTLHDLFSQRHDDLKEQWSDKYQKAQERKRRFWLKKLGHIELTKVGAALVERIAREAQGKRSDRWRQDMLRYIVDSFSYAERKLKWIDQRHNLSAVDMPSGKGESHAYTLEEGVELVKALWKVDPVAGWIGTVAFQTGRRLSAIRTLKPKHVEQGDPTIIGFPGETDKARKTGEAVVKGLPERTDWAVPRVETCLDWLHEAEKLAGIPHVKGRGYHGLKRLYATLTRDMVGADKQAGTLKSTLEGHYVQDVIGPKSEVADRLAGMLGGTFTVTDGHEDAPQESRK